MRRFNPLLLGAILLMLSGCLKNNGEPYPGARMETNEPDSGPIKFPEDILIKRPFSCVVTGEPAFLINIWIAETDYKFVKGSIADLESAEVFHNVKVGLDLRNSRYVQFNGDDFALRVARTKNADETYSAYLTNDGATFPATCTGNGIND